MTAIFRSVYEVISIFERTFQSFHEDVANTFNDDMARSFELGRMIPGSMRRRNFCRCSCSLISCAGAGDACGVNSCILRAAASAIESCEILPSSIAEG